MIQWRKIISFDFHHIPKLPIGFNWLEISLQGFSIYHAVYWFFVHCYRSREVAKESHFVQYNFIGNIGL